MKCKLFYGAYCTKPVAIYLTNGNATTDIEIILEVI